MLNKVLSFGGGLQTTAMVVMVATGQLKVDAVIFSDTGAEKPETYWYIENYIKNMVKLETLPVENGGLTGYCEKYRIVPSVVNRWCTRIFKSDRMNKYTAGSEVMIGFSTDEIRRSENPLLDGKTFPLIERGISSADCARIIQDYGLPVPVKSSCYYCPFQRWSEWNWLKLHNPELFAGALRLEDLLYQRKPEYKERTGLFGGKPLWKFAEGVQYEFGFPGEYSCWSGYCGR